MYGWAKMYKRPSFNGLYGRRGCDSGPEKPSAISRLDPQNRQPAKVVACCMLAAPHLLAKNAPSA